MFDEEMPALPPLTKAGHASHCTRCLTGLPASQVDIDPSKLALVFYCVGSLDLLGALTERASERERSHWVEWFWEQHTRGRYGAGFKPGPFVTVDRASESTSEFDTPHIIMTYTALLSLAILRDDFSRLDRAGIIRFLGACQTQDGSFTTVPGGSDSDLRAVYCAFAISNMLNDWSGFDVPAALNFIASCRTYEGGYGQSPFCEAHGGTTYTALAALYLAPPSDSKPLTEQERRQTIRWLIQKQDDSGGFSGRTNKEPDACYCFWCCASLEILHAKDLVEAPALAEFIASCQFKFGGIAKAPGEHPDPYHTYLSLAALSVCPPAVTGMIPPSHSSSWTFEALDPLINARIETVQWVRAHLSA